MLMGRVSDFSIANHVLLPWITYLVIKNLVLLRVTGSSMGESKIPPL